MHHPPKRCEGTPHTAVQGSCSLSQAHMCALGTASLGHRYAKISNQLRLSTHDTHKQLRLSKHDTHKQLRLSKHDTHKHTSCFHTALICVTCLALPIMDGEEQVLDGDGILLDMDGVGTSVEQVDRIVE
jgi:hypothetical protein